MLTNEWRYGDLAHNQRVTTTGLAPRTMVGGYEVDPHTIGQFTGLHDKNGREIYEGDLLHDDDVTIEVWYSEEKACFIAEMVNPANPLVTCLCDYDTSSMEVVGNIHDNPIRHDY